MVQYYVPLLSMFTLFMIFCLFSVNSSNVQWLNHISNTKYLYPFFDAIQNALWVARNHVVGFIFHECLSMIFHNSKFVKMKNLLESDNKWHLYDFNNGIRSMRSNSCYLINRNKIEEKLFFNAFVKKYLFFFSFS